MALSNTDRTELLKRHKRDQAILAKNYNPFGDQSLTSYRKSVGWENPDPRDEGPVGTGASYRNRPVRSFTNRPDSNLQNAQQVGALSPTKDQIEVLEKNNGVRVNTGKRFTIDDPNSFNPYQAGEQYAESELPEYFKEIFAGAGVSSESDLSPAQRKHWQAQKKTLRDARIEEAKNAQSVALRRKDAKGPSFAERKDKRELNRERFMAQNRISDQDGITASAPMTKAQRDAMEASGAKQGLLVFFDDVVQEETPWYYPGGGDEEPGFTVRKVVHAAQPPGGAAQPQGDGKVQSAGPLKEAGEAGGAAEGMPPPEALVGLQEGQRRTFGNGVVVEMRDGQISMVTNPQAQAQAPVQTPQVPAEQPRIARPPEPVTAVSRAQQLVNSVRAPQIPMEQPVEDPPSVSGFLEYLNQGGNPDTFQEGFVEPVKRAATAVQGAAVTAAEAAADFAQNEAFLKAGVAVFKAGRAVRGHVRRNWAEAMEQALMNYEKDSPAYRIHKTAMKNPEVMKDYINDVSNAKELGRPVPPFEEWLKLALITKKKGESGGIVHGFDAQGNARRFPGNTLRPGA